MKRSKNDYSKKTKVDLQKKISELGSSLQEMRFKMAANQLRGVRQVREAKKEIARIKTVYRQAK